MVPFINGWSPNFSSIIIIHKGGRERGTSHGIKMEKDERERERERESYQNV